MSADPNFPDFPSNPLPAIGAVANVGVANLFSRQHARDTAHALWVMGGCGLNAGFPVIDVAPSPPAVPADSTPVLKQVVPFSDEEAVRFCQQVMHDVDGGADAVQRIINISPETKAKLAQWALNALQQLLATLIAGG